MEYVRSPYPGLKKRSSLPQIHPLRWFNPPNTITPVRTSPRRQTHPRTQANRLHSASLLRSNTPSATSLIARRRVNVTPIAPPKAGLIDRWCLYPHPEPGASCPPGSAPSTLRPETAYRPPPPALTPIAVDYPIPPRTPVPALTSVPSPHALPPAASPEFAASWMPW